MNDQSDYSDSAAGRLGKCEVCIANFSKYTCPRCEVKTCSLACVKIHKDELECSGVRDKTLYKPLNKFSNLDLLSDYRLLEDISKTVQKYKKDVNKRYTRFQVTLPIQLYKLRGAAHSKGVRLLYLPQNFSKHRENTTYYEWKTKKFYWRIEWVFFTCSGVKKMVDERVLDTEKLGTAVSKYFQPEAEDADLELYYSAGYSGVIFLLKCEKTSEKFYELDASSSIRMNLRNKTIIEYPSIHVIFKHQRDQYELVDSDEEDEEIQEIHNNFNERDNVQQADNNTQDVIVL